jgi:hypothetical protein
LAIQIGLGMVMIIVTTVIQSGFTVAGVRALRQWVSKELTSSLWLSTVMLALFVLWLFLATLLEVWAWALAQHGRICRRGCLFFHGDILNTWLWRHNPRKAVAAIVVIRGS